MAIRLLESVNTLEALPQLATLVDHAGLRSLALYDIAGASMLRGVEPVHDIPQRAWHILMAALAALGAAVLIVLITVWPRNPLRTSIGERVNTFAAWLILGKKA